MDSIKAYINQNKRKKMIEKRFLLIVFSVITVSIIPWRTEKVIPAQIKMISDLKDFHESTSDSSLSNMSENLSHITLVCDVPEEEGMEFFQGQDAVFFPESEEMNPLYVSLDEPHFHKKNVHITGHPLKINQCFHGNIKGLIFIKSERQSLLMRAYKYFLFS